jgi:hypothetical protein
MNPFDMFGNPAMLHALVAHLPLALGIVGIPLVFVCAGMKMNNATLRWTSFALYALLALLSYAAVLTGQAVQTGVSLGLSPEVGKLVETHQWMAEQTWMFAAVTAALILICTLKVEWFRVAVATLVVLASFATGVWLVLTGNYGLTLVYKHNVGITQSAPLLQPIRQNGKEMQPAGSPAELLKPNPVKPSEPRIETETGEPLQP